ncbi:sortase domain-containing protein [Geodermatophilus sp. URMC 63]
MFVDRADGTTARFTVTEVERHPKDAFPTREVYGPTADAQLRLITCGGDFDRSARSYEDNVVVFATLTGWAAGASR